VTPDHVTGRKAHHLFIDQPVLQDTEAAALAAGGRHRRFRAR